MKKENFKQPLCVSCGKTTDSFEYLEKLCNQKAKELAATIEIPIGSIVEVAFWTENFPELIGVGRFKKDESKNVTYELDFSESTL